MTELTGRELDAEVAQRIFERKLKWIPDHSGVAHPYLLKEFRDGEYYVHHYSTDMTAAWRVAEKIRERTGYFRLTWWSGLNRWQCEYRPGNDITEEYFFAPGITAPEAICHAALKLAREETGD